MVLNPYWIPGMDRIVYIHSLICYILCFLCLQIFTLSYTESHIFIFRAHFSFIYSYIWIWMYVYMYINMYKCIENLSTWCTHSRPLLPLSAYNFHIVYNMLFIFFTVHIMHRLPHTSLFLHIARNKAYRVLSCMSSCWYHIKINI